MEFHEHPRTLRAALAATALLAAVALSGCTAGGYKPSPSPSPSPGNVACERLNPAWPTASADPGQRSAAHLGGALDCDRE